jgi:FixJ family two-component response regulator
VNSALIAIVDDDDMLRSSIANLMRSFGYRAEPFASAEALLMSSRLPLFDCVVADVHMPGMDGFGLARWLAKRDRWVPLILITASSERRLDDEAISAGARCFLRKPIEIKALADCVERGISGGGSHG